MANIANRPLYCRVHALANGVHIFNINTFEGLTYFEEIVAREAKYQDGKNADEHRRLVRSIDPNNRYGIQAMNLVELTEFDVSDPNSEGVVLAYDYFAKKIDLSKCNPNTDKTYFHALIQSEYLQGGRLTNEILAKYDELDAEFFIQLGLSLRDPGTKDKSIRGFYGIFAYLNSIDAFDIRPDLLTSMIKAYGALPEWQEQSNSDFLPVLERFFAKRNLSNFRVELDALVETATQSDDSFREFFLIRSKIFPKNSNWIMDLFGSLVVKATPGVLSDEKTELAQEWLEITENLLLKREMNTLTSNEKGDTGHDIGNL